MPSNLRLGQEKVSPIQERLLAVARKSVSGLTQGLLQLSQDDDITSGLENIHPDWLSLLEMHRDAIRADVPRRVYDQIDIFFGQLLPVDKTVGQLNPAALKACFLLGAGASKPPPSDIPTVKELLPQLLERARRLDRDDVTKLADYCDQRRIDNIEDLLTAAQLATFCSRNPIVLGLVNFLLYRGELDVSSDLPMGQFSAITLERVYYSRHRQVTADLSSVTFLQDTLQVLFGLLSSRMISAQPNPAHTSIAEYS